MTVRNGYCFETRDACGNRRRLSPSHPSEIRTMKLGQPRLSPGPRSISLTLDRASSVPRAAPAGSRPGRVTITLPSACITLLSGVTTIGSPRWASNRCWSSTLAARDLSIHRDRNGLTKALIVVRPGKARPGEIRASLGRSSPSQTGMAHL